MSGYTEIIHRYEDELLNSIVPFWMNHAFDPEHGGFFNDLNRDGSCFDTTKYFCMQWRNVYSFAMLHNSEYSRSGWLELAQQGFDFCWKSRQADGAYPQVTDASGKAIVSGDGFSGTMIFVYAGCACAELFRATGEERYRAEAQSCFTNYLTRLKESEHCSRSEFFPALRRRGCYMHLCHLCRTMIVCGCEFGDGRVRTALEMTLRIIPGFYCAEIGRWVEHRPTDGEIRLDNALFRGMVPGHDFETMWFMAQGAELLDDRETLEKIPAWTEQIFGYTTDRRFGGLFHYMDALDKPVADSRSMVKAWWTHNEAQLAAIFSFKLSGDERFLRHFMEIDAWSWKNFRDPVYPEWFVLVHSDGSTENYVKGCNYKTFFHLPRMLYNCLAVLKTL